MARVLFVNGPAEGHMNPTLGVVQELVRRGEEVVYFTTESFRAKVEAAGATVRTYDGAQFFQTFMGKGYNHLLDKVNGLMRTTDIVVPAIMEQIKGEQFDYIIHDSMFGCGRIIAQILGLPAISSNTSFAQNPFGFDKVLESMSRFNSPEVNEEVKKEFYELAASTGEKYGVEIGSPYEVFCNPAPMTIVYTTREFQPFGQSFDASYKFVGPSIGARPPLGDFDLAALEGKSVIYISLGTVFNKSVDFYKQCFAAFGHTEHTVVLSIGRQLQIEDLGEIPVNFIVKNYVPQPDVLQRANLFITHGGMNSTSEGIYYGVPLVVIPQMADQPFVARRVEEVGAGMQLDKNTLTADALRETAEHVLSTPSFREAVAKLSESFQDAGGYVQAVDEIFACTRD